MSTSQITPEEIERFGSNIVPEPNSGCFLWIGAVNAGGHGRFHYGGAFGIASRFAWESERGTIPPGLFVLHHCDVPSCVNVRHLFIGTLSDNVQDMVKKKRHYHQGRTHCFSGHLLDGIRQSHGRASRRCMECRRLGDRKRRAEHARGAA